MVEHLVAEVGIHLEPGTAGTPDLKRQEQMSVNKINNKIFNTKYPDKIQLEFNSLLFILTHTHLCWQDHKSDCYASFSRLHAN